jgi:hypothetical protein
MLNWKTTLMGALAAMAPFIRSVLPEGLAPIADAIQALALALLGYFAKDKNVTGVS